MNNFIDCGEAVSHAQVTALQTHLGVDLPQSYFEFLSLHNGARPIKNSVDIQGLAESPTDVQVLFGLTRDIASSNVEWNARLIKAQHPNLGVVPIGCDSGGNLFCLKVNDPADSSVVYVDLADPLSAPYQVANSFDDFVQMLRD